MQVSLMTEHSEDAPHMHTSLSHVSLLPEQLGDNPHIQVPLLHVSPAGQEEDSPHMQVVPVHVSPVAHAGLHVAAAEKDKFE